ncbi:nuclear pore complex subunit [Sphingobacteriaceae bacterium]|nr:nuclear pore complex subunit [Sphingobacteriaceae bacterium]
METLELKISGTEDTPEISFNNETKEFMISGRSLPEDVSTFYKPVFEWLDFFATTTSLNTVFKFKLEYFNTASSKIILDILMKLEELQNSNNFAISIEWFYNESDDDMQEAGEEYKELVEVPFNVIAY